MNFRFHLPALLATLALVAAGCGGSDGASSAAGTDSAASIVPASAVAYIWLDTDLESDQWAQVKELAEKFPGKDDAVAGILKSLSDEGLDWERDVEPALGPEVALAVLVRNGEPRPVLVTQPDDEEKLRALAAKAEEPAVTREVEDWWAVAETAQDIDAFEAAQDDGPLADDDRYRQAVADLPEEALATFFVDGERAQDALTQGPGNPFGGNSRLLWLGGALEALGEGAKLSGSMRVTGTLAGLGASYTPELLERVPRGSLAVLSFRNAESGLEQLRSNPFAAEFIPQLERSIGVTLTEIADLLRGEGIVYVRQGAPIPEITLALQVDDPAKARATVDSIVERIAPLVEGRTGSAEVDGVSTRYLEVQGVRITYATFDGLLFVTSGPSGLAEFRRTGEKLADDEVFTRTKEAAGLGDETSGFLYVNLREAIGLIQGFAGVAGESVPPEVSANLAPLDTLLVHGARDGDDVEFTGFLGIR